jgi:hypothetical protein
MKSVAEMNQGELAAFIQSHLRAKGIDVVLTGGSAVSIYSKGKYVSNDLDFVVESFTRRQKIQDAMSELGFQEVGRHYEHPAVALVVEFPGGPLSVGKQRVGKIETLEYETGNLRIISPTDCVKDRLAAYFFWGDRQSLDQAIMVARDYEIDIEEIANWALEEDLQAEFEVIELQIR